MHIQKLKCTSLIHIVVIFMDHRLGLSQTEKQTKWLQHGIRGVRKIWCLPFESHRNILCGLKNGEHIWDCIFKIFCGMFESMTNCKNKKLEYLVKLGNQDCRTIIARNIRVICDKWSV